MKNIEVEFLVTDNVWFMYNNSTKCAKISEIKIAENEITYWFWWQNVVSERKCFDKNIHTENTFSIHIDSLYATKKDLLASL